MDLQKVILYYRFAPIADPEAMRLWQETLCQSLGLKGRIIISKDGINGTLGGDMSALKRYVTQSKKYPGFNKIDFKWSDGTGNDFPGLKIRVRDELVSFGSAKDLVVDANGVVGAGKHLNPYEVHKLVEERGDEVVFFDARNAFEAKIGKFKDAIIPSAKTARDFVGEIESGKYDHLKDRPIITYCTGGIRCEILSSVMTKHGFNEVYQLEGGIARYGNKYGDDGLWQGSLYTFDARMAIDFSDKADVIGRCEKCESPTNKFHSCSEVSCYELILLCESCALIPANLACFHDVKKGAKSELIG
ncbi:MAG: rhodanese-related sulfurtransferase [Actinobacteria bacterium]|nr:rhodanese-related sulfurtransferase [Actinomycetota bacterium]